MKIDHVYKVLLSVHLHPDPCPAHHCLLLDLRPVLQLTLAPPQHRQVQLHRWFRNGQIFSTESIFYFLIRLGPLNLDINKILLTE